MMLPTRIRSICILIYYILHVSCSDSFYIGPSRHCSVIRWNPRNEVIVISTFGTTNGNIPHIEEEQQEDEKLMPAEIRLLSSKNRYAYRIQQLIQFHQQHGHFCVRERHDKTLSQWVRTQQYEYKRWRNDLPSLITQQRIEQLNDIGFKWETSDGLTNEWMIMFHALEAFQKQHGHLRLRAQDGTLGKWVANQRHQYRKYQQQQTSSLMTPARIQKLNSIGMIWDRKATQSTRHDEKWEESLQQLIIYRNQHGHCQIPKSAGPLALWVSNQRLGYTQRMKHLPSTFTMDRQKKLIAAGLDVSIPPYHDQWIRNYQELCAFHAQHGHFRIPKSPLATWVARQRRDYRNAQTQSPTQRWKDREPLLRSIGFLSTANQTRH